ncbi:RidA family protein [Nocardia tengchongensis]|uniref:RidA family protein n=1 Tax=Nocardia tengchongensis TaxID=2055889 RepID=UPI0036B18DBB
MHTTAFAAENIPGPAANYSPAVRRGPILAVSGQVAFLPGHIDGPPPGIEEQAEAVFANLRSVLAAAGSSFADVVMVRIYLAREEDFAAMNEVFDRTFTPPFPARTTVWVHLPAGLLIEADLLAVTS